MNKKFYSPASCVVWIQKHIWEDLLTRGIHTPAPDERCLFTERQLVLNFMGFMVGAVSMGFRSGVHRHTCATVTTTLTRMLAF